MKMWFRLTSGQSDVEPSSNTAATTSATVDSNFEKLRVSSFKKKNGAVGRRSKSPHYMTCTAGQINTSFEEEAAGEDDDEASFAMPTAENIHNSQVAQQFNNPIYRAEVDIFVAQANPVQTKDEEYLQDNSCVSAKPPTPAIPTNTSNATLIFPLSDLKSKLTKKTTLKAIKTDPPKRKFYKNFSASHLRGDVTAKPQAEIINENDEPPNGKEKILLTDRKFKNNRIEKSSSKTKIHGTVELEKRESVKRSGTARKTSAPPITVDGSKEKRSKKDESAGAKKVGGSHARTHSNLNLNALVKLVVNNKRFINSNDFALIRRKSLAEAASSVISMAATCKPLPIALKCSPTTTTKTSTDAGKVVSSANEWSNSGSVILVGHDLKSSFCDRINNNTNNSSIENNNDLVIKENIRNNNKKRARGSSIASKNNNSQIFNRHSTSSSGSANSSGNWNNKSLHTPYSEEEFYSCEDDGERQQCRDMNHEHEQYHRSSHQSCTKTDVIAANVETSKRKSSSPSLTSRVAAKINETTSNYKNRRAAAASKMTKKRKSLVTGKRPEYYKQISVERLHSTSIVRQPSDRRPDVANASVRSNGNLSHNNSESLDADSNADTNALDAEKDARRDRSQQSAPVSVNRSESYKERLSHKRNRNNRRKTSDPSLSSRPNDDQNDLGLSNSNYTASSNSSLSSGGGSESPSTSMEQVGGPPVVPHGSVGHTATNSVHNHSSSGGGGGVGGGSIANSSINWGGSGGPTITSGGVLTRQWQFESDDDDDLLHEVDWSSNVAMEMLAALTDAEKKRQEIINEIYQTERSHVRTLKLLERIFMCPLHDSGVLSPDHLMLLFPPALLSLKELHSSFEQQLKMRRLEHNHIVSHVGDLLAGMFDGQSGEELREYAAQFCARQQIALEALKEKRRKDEQLQKMLTKAESHKACRRLQLKDLLPTVLQRLTKYPLLFENLYKITIRVLPDDKTEAEAVQRALDSSKKILVDVNQAVKTAEDAHKLQSIQRKLDKSTFDKEEFKNLDLTQFKLIHDGSLTMKKNPGIQLHGLLFENMIVLLTRQDDKYSLKSLAATRSSEVNKFISPITYIDQETLVRQEAADKNSFFLIMTKTSQMLELRAPSSSECKTWFKHISDAAEQYKPRSKSSHEVADDPAIATLPHSNTKESLEITQDRPPPPSATATVTTTQLAPFATQMTNNNSSADGGRSSVSCREETPSTDSTTKNRNNLTNNNDMSAASGGNGGVGVSVNRTMSTRSCGESNINVGGGIVGDTAGDSNRITLGGATVQLRHTQSARGAGNDNSSSSSFVSGNNASHRDSTSIIYSNNSNNTRTLMQNSALVEPSAIQISISPAHTAEPVLTPSERLKRLDVSIREGLVEKQRIICDMFRLPIEHFNEIIDIAGQPEAPKDSADIALAAYAQVQSLTEVLNEYMKISAAQQDISVVSTSVCDQCHQQQRNELQQNHRCGLRSLSPLSLSSAANNATTTTGQTAVPGATVSGGVVDDSGLHVNATGNSSINNFSRSPTPPPLPPPNNSKNRINQIQKQLPPKAQSLDDQIIHEDDDGYCEIDELRLPSLSLPTKINTPPLSASQSQPSTTLSSAISPPPLPPPASMGAFKAVPPLPIGIAAEVAIQQQQRSTPTPELVKRQSTISADSIPEESEQDMTQLDELTLSCSVSISKEGQDEEHQQTPSASLGNSSSSNACNSASNISSSSSSSAAQPQDHHQNQQDSANTDESVSSEHIEINDTYDTMATLNKMNASLSMVDSSSDCQTMPGTILCGPNRLLHASSLEPSVPCHAINNIVSALNTQISLLLPKINERDLERERLRKENQHLRELLNAMHERQRVESKCETPTDITISAETSDEISLATAAE